MKTLCHAEESAQQMHCIPLQLEETTSFPDNQTFRSSRRDLGHIPIIWKRIVSCTCTAFHHFDLLLLKINQRQCTKLCTMCTAHGCACSSCSCSAIMTSCVPSGRSRCNLKSLCCPIGLGACSGVRICVSLTSGACAYFLALAYKIIKNFITRRNPTLILSDTSVIIWPRHCYGP